MRVGIDLDGVCADYIGALRLAGREAGHEITSTYPETYDMVGGGWFPSHEAWRVAHDAAMPLAAGFPALVSAADFEPLKQIGAELVAITARETDYFGQTCVWIDKNLPGVFDRIVFTGDKHAYGLDVLIEDNPAEVGAGDTPVVLVDYPYNRHVQPEYRAFTTCIALRYVAQNEETLTVGNLGLRSNLP